MHDFVCKMGLGRQGGEAQRSMAMIQDMEQRVQAKTG